MKTDFQTEQVGHTFRKHGVVFGYLFGSGASCTAGALSDLDFAVYMNRRVGLEDRLALQADLARTLGRSDIDVVVLNGLKNIVLADTITRTGRVLLDADPEKRADYELRVQHRAMDFLEQRKRLVGV